MVPISTNFDMGQAAEDMGKSIFDFRGRRFSD